MAKESTRTRVRRYPERGVYDRAVIDSILDEGLICHVGFLDDGQPVVIPTLYARIADDVYIHGSAASRMLRRLETGADVCLTVTLIDGLVLARAAFHHPVNYRSVVVFGRARVVTNPAEKSRALEAFTEQIVPGRWADIRPPIPRELKATTVLALPIDESSAKVRSGPPSDDAADYRRPTWAGVLPLRLSAGAPISDTGLAADITVPDYVRNYRRSAGVVRFGWPKRAAIQMEESAMGQEPGPEQRRLAALVGRWRTEGWTRETDGVPAQKIDAWDTYEWLPGGFALLHSVDARVGDEQVAGAEIIGWDPGHGCYVTQYFGTDGPSAYEATLADKGGRLEWSMHSDSNRFTGTFTDDGNAIAGHWEQLDEAKQWRPWMDITLTRQ
jgi:uncharacterized protein